jgi:hypothetical protein
VHAWSPEIVVDEGLCRRVIRDQFPQVEARSVRLLGEGWDNTVWLVESESVEGLTRTGEPS